MRLGTLSHFWFTLLFLFLFGCSQGPQLKKDFGSDGVLRYKFLQNSDAQGIVRIQGGFQAYHRDGSPWFHVQIHSGTIQGEFSWYEKSAGARLEWNYRHGMRDGEFQEFGSAGELWKRGSYAGGKKEGLHEIFYSDQRLQSRRRYVNGKADGLQTEFFPSGQVRKKEMKENGKLIWEHLYRKEGILEAIRETRGESLFDYKLETTVELFLDGSPRLAFSTVRNGEFSGKKTGPEKHWHPGRTLSEEKVWSFGEVLEHKKWSDQEVLLLHKKFEGKQGFGKSWYSDGKLKYEENYQNSQRHGLREVWHQNS
ncbi:hypothetical protein HOF92_10410, partial [bacterium]|nr:hypothetical protein [bacterium]